MTSHAAFCIYTIKHSERLKREAIEGKSHSLTERTPWTTGRRLLFDAKRAGERMPLLFAGAEDVTGLIYWALIEDITIDDQRTTCTYSELRPIDPSKAISTLKLRSSRRPLSDNYIRPYAICETPEFLQASEDSDEAWG